MLSVSDALRAKSYQEVFHVTPDTTVFEAIRLMSEKGIGALVVLHQGRLVGMFSERDYTRKIALFDRSSRTTRVSEIMTTTLTTAEPHLSIPHCLSLMTDKHIRHLPVLDANQKVLGMVSIGDLVKETISQQAFLIKQLEQYIAG